MIIKAEVLKALIPVTSDDPRRPILACIQVDETRKRVIATDGHVAFIATDDRPMPDDDFPTKGIPETVGTMATPVLLTANVAARLLAAMPKKTPIPILKAAKIGIADGVAVASATDLEAPCTITLGHQDATYPDVAKVMPAEDRPELTVTLGVEVLETIIKAAKAIGSEAVRFGVSSRKHDQEQVPAEGHHAFVWNGLNSGDHCRECGEKQADHKLTGNGTVNVPVRVYMAKDGITLAGCAMPIARAR